MNRPGPAADHGHGHAHLHGDAHGTAAGTRSLGVAFGLNLVFAFIELGGALLTNSVAVLADALHDFGDCASLGFAYGMQRLSGRAPDARFSYGYRRFSLLAALVTGGVLLIGSVAIFVTALPRLWHPEPVMASGVLALAVLGLAVNGYAALRTHHGTSMSERMVTLHLLEDVLGWAAVLVMAAVLLVTDWYWLDPLISLLVATLMLWNVGRNLYRTALVFLQATPREYDIAALEDNLRAVPCVRSVHDTHLWSMDGEYHVLSTHLVVPADVTLEQVHGVKQNAREVFARYQVDHATVEVEREHEVCELRHCR